MFESSRIGSKLKVTVCYYGWNEACWHGMGPMPRTSGSPASTLTSPCHRCRCYLSNSKDRSNNFSCGHLRVILLSHIVTVWQVICNSAKLVIFSRSVSVNSLILCLAASHGILCMESKTRPGLGRVPADVRRQWGGQTPPALLLSWIVCSSGTPLGV